MVPFALLAALRSQGREGQIILILLSIFLELNLMAPISCCLLRGAYGLCVINRNQSIRDKPCSYSLLVANLPLGARWCCC